jgi:hypothetical protein
MAPVPDDEAHAGCTTSSPDGWDELIVQWAAGRIVSLDIGLDSW